MTNHDDNVLAGEGLKRPPNDVHVHLRWFRCRECTNVFYVNNQSPEFYPVNCCYCGVKMFRPGGALPNGKKKTDKD